MDSARTARDNTISYAGKGMRYAGRSTGAVLLAAGITATMLGIGYGNKVNAGDQISQPTRVVYATGVPEGTCPPNTAEGTKGTIRWTTCDNANNSSPNTNPTPGQRTADNPPNPGGPGDIDMTVSNTDPWHPIEVYDNISINPALASSALVKTRICVPGQRVDFYVNNNFLGSIGNTTTNGCASPANYSVFSFPVNTLNLFQGDNLAKWVIDPLNPASGNTAIVDYVSIEPVPVGGLAGAPEIGKYPLAEPSGGVDGKAIGIAAGAAAALALSGAGGLYYNIRRRD